MHTSFDILNQLFSPKVLARYVTKSLVGILIDLHNVRDSLLFLLEENNTKLT